MQTVHGSIVRLAGELDIAVTDSVAATLNTALRDLPPDAPALVVDFEAVTFLDVVALGVLVQAKVLAADAGVAFELMDVSPRIARVLRIAGLEGLLGAVSATRPA